jgi:hypothetical protein
MHWNGNLILLIFSPLKLGDNRQANNLSHFPTVCGVTDNGNFLIIAGTASVALAAMIVCTANGNTFWCGFGVMDNCRTMHTSGKGTIHGIG